MKSIDFTILPHVSTGDALQVLSDLSTERVVLYGDAEWNSQDELTPLLHTLYVPQVDTYVLLASSELYEALTSALPRLRAPSRLVVIDPGAIYPVDLVHALLPRVERFEYRHYFSANDVNHLVGREVAVRVWRKENGFTSEKRNILQTTFKIEGRKWSTLDVSGNARKGKLSEQAKSVGLATSWKSYTPGDMAHFGATFLKGMRGTVEQAQQALDYVLEDVHQLHEIRTRQEAARLATLNSLHLPALPFQPTLGSNVAHLGEAWVWASIDSVPRERVLRAWFQHAVYQEHNSKERSQYRALRRAEKPSASAIERLVSGPHGGARPYLLASHTHLALQAVVAGGRAFKERQLRLSFGPGFDLDIGGAYPSVMRQLPYVLGNVRTWAPAANTTHRRKAVRLGDLFKRGIPQAGVSPISQWLPRAWTIRVSGKFNKLKQDLVPSTDGTNAAAGAAITSGSKYGASMLWLSDALENGILTSYSLGVLEAVTSNSEWTQILNLEVESIAYYDTSDQVQSIEELVERWESRGEGDSDEFSFLSLRLEDLVGQLVAKRSVVKHASKRTYSTEESRQELVATLQSAGISTTAYEYAPLESLPALLHAAQENLKLNNNGLYGVLASPYFDFSQPVIGNNITDAIRVQVWLMAKSLGLVQTITDGGIMEVDNVPQITRANGGRLPGLSSFWELPFTDAKSRTHGGRKGHRGLKWSPLGGIDWSTLFDRARTEGYKALQEGIEAQGYASINDVAQAHLRAFWAPYSERPARVSGVSSIREVVESITIEAKEKNTFLGAAVLPTSNAHYGLVLLSGKDKVATGETFDEDEVEVATSIRGQVADEQRNSLQGRVLRYFALHGAGMNPRRTWDESSLRGVRRHIVALAEWYKANRNVSEPEILPGMTTLVERYYGLNPYKGQRQTTLEGVKSQKRRAAREDKSIHSGVLTRLDKLLLDNHLSAAALEAALVAPQVNSSVKAA